MRPVQWAKNVFVLAPIVFAQRLDDREALVRVAIAFGAFCAAASAIYLFNDLRDREEDRRHPQKRLRPIASGAVSPTVAGAAAVVLGLVGLGIAYGLGTAVGGLVAIYIGINLAYATWLKRMVILDVMAVSSGYVIRVQAGADAVPVEVSNWLVLCTIFLSLLLIFSKRRHELVLLQDGATEQRAVLSHYSQAFLDQMINVVTASTVVAYALYAVDEDTVLRFGTDRLVWTVPLVLFGIFRYLYLVYQRTDLRNPTETIVTDLPSVLNVALWGLLVLWLTMG